MRLNSKESKSSFVTLAAACTLAFTAGCGDKAKEVADGIDEKVAELRMNAKWGSSCQNTILDLFGLSSQTELFDIGASLSKTTTFYREDNCAVPVVTVVENGDYQLGAEVAQGAYAFDARFDSAWMVAVNEDGKKILNDLKACGIDDWQVGVPRDVTSRTSDVPLIDRCWSKTPRSLYDLAHVSGDQLKFGLVKDGKDKTAPDRRPNEIDQAYVLNRQ